MDHNDDDDGPRESSDHNDVTTILGTHASSEEELDPHAIFNASLQFKHTTPIPLPQQVVDSRRSSSDSLYPCVASLTDLEDTVDVERNWEAAGKVSVRNLLSHRNRMRPRGQVAFPKTSSVAHVASAADHPQVVATASASVTAATATATATPIASLSTAASTAAARVSPSNTSEDDDLLAQKLAAYGGVNSFVTVQPQPSAVAAMPDANGQLEDDMLQMKIAAYEGRLDENSYGAASRIPEMQALVVEDYAHPADTTAHTVQAEFIAPATNAAANQGEAIQDVSASTAAEATVIESGPLEKATAEAWSAAPAAEATVLHDDGLQPNTTDLDCKPPARNSLVHPLMQAEAVETDAGQQAEVTAVEYEVHPAEITADAVQAEFVGQEFNTSAQSSESGQEQLISAEGAQVTRLSTERTYAVDGNHVEEEEVTEVAVIESGPMEKATAEAWSASPSGEAQVLEQMTTVAAATLDAKPPASAGTDSWEAGVARESGYGLMEGEAEVVGITEDVHPAEFAENASAQAELIGSDFNTAIAVPSTATTPAALESEGAMQAEIILENGTEVSPYDSSTLNRTVDTQEAHATLLNEGDYGNYDQQNGEVAAVTAVFEGTEGAALDESSHLPATPVAVLEDMSWAATPAAFSYSDPVKPQPFSGRATTAPVLVESRSGLDTVSPLPRETSSERNGSAHTPGRSERIVSATSDPSSIRSPTSPPPVPSPQQMAEASTACRTSGRKNMSVNSDSSVPGFQSVSCGGLLTWSGHSSRLTVFSQLALAFIKFCTWSKQCYGNFVWQRNTRQSSTTSPGRIRSGQDERICSTSDTFAIFCYIFRGYQFMGGNRQHEPEGSRG